MPIQSGLEIGRNKTRATPSTLRQREKRNLKEKKLKEKNTEEKLLFFFFFFFFSRNQFVRVTIEEFQDRQNTPAAQRNE